MALWVLGPVLFGEVICGRKQSLEPRRQWEQGQLSLCDLACRPRMQKLQSSGRLKVNTWHDKSHVFNLRKHGALHL